MFVTITAQHVKAAIKEYKETPILNKNAPTCCPLHQAMRNHIHHLFDVGAETIGIRYSEKTHPEEVNRSLSFSPALPRELYLQPEWERALKAIEEGHVYEFSVEDIYAIQ